jgi:hypothetical protein
MSNNHRNRQQHSSHSGGPATAHHGSTAEETAALNETLKSFSEKYHEDDPKKSRRERIKFRLEIALGVGVALNIALTIGLLVAAAIQAKYSGEQVNVALDSEHRQLRAYVGMNPGDIDDFGISGKQRIRFIRKNFGATPAYDVGFSQLGFSIVKIGQPIDTGRSGCNTPAIPGLITMFPTTELAWTITIGKNDDVRPEVAAKLGGMFAPEEVQLVKSGDRQFVYWGTVCYKDAFNVPHFTNYCWMYKGTSMAAKDAEGCLGHNDSN